MTNYPEQICLKTNTRGFTLIEILVALAIFSIGIMAVAKLQLWNVKNNTNSNIATMATMLAREKLEWMKSLDLHDAEMVSGVEPDIDSNGDPGGIFSREWVVTPDSTDTTCRIDMQVSWTRQGKTRNVELTTITRGNGT